jgi:hypothetical protein
MKTRAYLRFNASHAETALPYGLQRPAVLHKLRGFLHNTQTQSPAQSNHSSAIAL